ncbi:MAG: glycosyltransferase family 4 protein [Verrucomicrobiota bacterium]
MNSNSTADLGWVDRRADSCRPGVVSHPAAGKTSATAGLRVAFVVTRADSFGGASVHVRDFARVLLASGHQPMVFVGGEGPVVDSLRQASIPVVVLRHLARPIRLGSDLRALWELRSALKRFRPDIVSTHTSKAGFLGRMAAWSLHLPVLYTPHCWSFVDGFPGARLYLWAERFARPFGRRIVMVSENERQEGLRQRIGSAHHLVTVHNGMPDLPPGWRADPGLCPPRITMIGRCEAQKDHFTLLRALARITDLPWTLDLVGDGPLRGEVEAEIRRLDLGSRVNLLGYRRDIAGILKETQIFALVTNWESFPRSILEAMRAGLPVVASAVGGTAESVEHGRTGYIVKRGDVTELAEHLRQLIENRELRITFGTAGRRRYEDQFTFPHMVRKTAKVWEDVLGRPVRIDRLEIPADR